MTWRTWSGAWLLALAGLMMSCGSPAPPPARTVPAEITFAVRPNPPVAGDQTELVFTVRRDDRLISSGQVAAQVVIDTPTHPTRPRPVALDGDGSGHWWTSFTFPTAGGWAAAVRVTQTDNEPVEANFDFDVAPP